MGGRVGGRAAPPRQAPPGGWRRGGMRRLSTDRTLAPGCKMSDPKYAYPYPAQGYYQGPPVMAPPQYAAPPPRRQAGFLEGCSSLKIMLIVLLLSSPRCLLVRANCGLLLSAVSLLCVVAALSTKEEGFGSRSGGGEDKMKTTKGGKVMNPTDAYRKEIRKKELKRVPNVNPLVSPFY
ncbi:hypothetical protein B296_00034158 [Ensete ventricosum]|uniref:Wbp11/ELF5/Saf1 N-terminal domain-containing protein n=1 Tax=Ensete ventricosum TaxID=4639 RepID=A0A426ZYQ9_ENSVE|nr:hypothetical protein B296_00034158 [Ensete ventricosum]